MRRAIPVFRNQSESFEADTCQPLVEAAARNEVRLQALVHGHYPGRKLPKDELPGLKTVGYWDAAGSQSWGLPWHRNEGIEITFLETGRLAFSLDDQEYQLQPDALTIARPWQRHCVGNPTVAAGKLHWLMIDVGVRRPNQPWKFPHWILLSERDREELAVILRQTVQPVWKASSEIRHCFHTIGVAIEADLEGSSISTLSIRINELLLLLLESLRKQKPRLNEALTSSRGTVEHFLEGLRQDREQLADQWSVASMADWCGLGVTQFVHIVKQTTNMTPMRYLSHCRMQLAAALIAENQVRSMAELAQVCGFSSSQYFATVFARQFGCAPTAYRGRLG